MTVSCMQPYLFPYLGYFQLIEASDHFVFLDHVNFIKKGWINRNRLKGSNSIITFSVPLHKASQNKSINDTYLSGEFQKWKGKFLRQMELEYKKAPYFTEIASLVERTLSVDEQTSISELAMSSVRNTIDYLGLNRDISLSSDYNVQHLKGQEIILELCKQLNADTYINPIGGKDLYANDTFSSKNIVLKIHNKLPVEYAQPKAPFIDNLSIIDCLMNCDKDEIRNDLLTKYELS